MKAVVTGASGFVGSRLAAQLLREGHQVVAGSRKPVPELVALGARHAPLDLSDRDALRNAFKDADIVYCDSWMSYTIPAAERHERFKVFTACLRY